LPETTGERSQSARVAQLDHGVGSAARCVLSWERSVAETQYQPSEASRQMDQINRRAWSDRSTVRSFRDREGWTDEGERVAFECVRVDAANQPILDLGVGAGRTVPLLRSISNDYVGLDYTPELVQACREKHPGARIVQGDARDLSQFADASFQLVVFSFNGIDAVNADDRASILREVRRVLRVGGAFLFSSHNRNGPGHSEGLSYGVYKTRNPVRLAHRLTVAVIHAARTIRNYERYSKLNYDGDGYSIRNASAHDHGIVIHYISLLDQLSQLARVGFRPGPLVFANSDGRQLLSGDSTGDVWWFHLVVRK
jgi:ubiquinone/menaquinone biosynthesis C-methylase UbiE